MDNKISDLEDRLNTAMQESDVATLDLLLADNLIFTNHLGQIMTKQDDLNAHQSGFVDIEAIERSEQQILQQETLAIVSVLARIRGRFGQDYAALPLRFTRMWQRSKKGDFQVIAAHSSLMAQPR